MASLEEFAQALASLTGGGGAPLGAGGGSPVGAMGPMPGAMPATYMPVSGGGPIPDLPLVPDILEGGANALLGSLFGGGGGVVAGADGGQFRQSGERATPMPFLTENPVSGSPVYYYPVTLTKTKLRKLVHAATATRRCRRPR